MSGSAQTVRPTRGISSPHPLHWEVGRPVYRASQPVRRFERHYGLAGMSQFDAGTKAGSTIICRYESEASLDIFFSSYEHAEQQALAIAELAAGTTANKVLVEVVTTLGTTMGEAGGTLIAGSAEVGTTLNPTSAEVAISLSTAYPAEPLSIVYAINLRNWLNPVRQRLEEMLDAFTETPKPIRTATPFEVQAPDEALTFLAKHSFLEPLLDEARAEITNLFGPDTTSALELITDPESDGSKKLILYIRPNLTVDEACDRLNRFDRDWWLDEIPRANGLLTVDVDFSSCSIGTST